MARWENKNYFAWEGHAECSECGKTTRANKHDNGWSIDYMFPKYCPNCGAKMEEEEGDGDGN